MAFAHLPVHAARVEVHEVMREPLGAVPPAEEFAGLESVSLPELAGHSHVNADPGMLPTYFEQLAVRLSAAGITKRINLRTGDYGSSSEVAANGSAFAISMLGPESSMHKYRNESIVTLPFDDFHPALKTGLTWRSDRAEKGAEPHELAAKPKRVIARNEPLNT